MSKFIPLNSKKYPNLYTIIDDEDFDLVKKLKWHPFKAKNKFYAKHGLWKDKKRCCLFIHRFIMEHHQHDITNKMIDHIDGNPLNNCKTNLRVCVNSENQHNALKTKLKRSSKYKGVTFNKHAQSYQVNIIHNMKRIYLGYFKDENEAGLAYNKKAQELFGEFACLNDIGGEHE